MDFHLLSTFTGKHVFLVVSLYNCTLRIFLSHWVLGTKVNTEFLNNNKKHSPTVLKAALKFNWTSLLQYESIQFLYTLGCLFYVDKWSPLDAKQGLRK